MCIINLILVVTSCLAALWLLRDIDDLIHKLTNLLFAKCTNICKICKITTQTMTNFAVIILLTATRIYTQFKTQQPHCQQRCLPSKQVKDQHVLIQVHWKRFAFYILHPHLWNRTQLCTRARLCLVQWHNINIFQCNVTEIHGAWRPALFIGLLACTNK